MCQNRQPRLGESKRVGCNRRCQRLQREGDWSHQVGLLHEERHESRHEAQQPPWIRWAGNVQDYAKSETLQRQSWMSCLVNVEMSQSDVRTT
jgi:hypothetical protein